MLSLRPSPFHFGISEYPFKQLLPKAYSGLASCYYNLLLFIYVDCNFLKIALDDDGICVYDVVIAMYLQ